MLDPWVSVYQMRYTIVPAFMLVSLLRTRAIFSSMKREDAISRLRAHEAELKRLGVEHLYMFGSTARDDARADSDVDLFFDHERGKLGLFELMDVKECAADILGRNVDVMTRASLHPALKKRIEETAVLIF